MFRLVIMISGSGTNLQAIIDAVDVGYLNAKIAAVISNRKNAYGLIRAASVGIPTLYFPLKAYTEIGKSRTNYDIDLAQNVALYHPDLIVLVGWMHVLSSAFLDCFPHRVINLHPALPGMFAGTNAIEKAFRAFQRGEITHTGCMVHYVIPEVDAGEVISKSVVPIYHEDTLEQLESRVHEAEHRLIVEAIQTALTNYC